MDGLNGRVGEYTVNILFDPFQIIVEKDGRERPIVWSEHPKSLTVGEMIDVIRAKTESQ